MKRFLLLGILVLLVVVSGGLVLADKPTQFDGAGNEKAWAASANATCVRIQDGTLLYTTGHYLAGQPLQLGYDPYGYNYQGHMFNGSYANVYLGREGFPPYAGDTSAYLASLTPAQQTAVQAKWYWPYRDDNLIMKWSDPWLANVDCNNDGKLDRGLVDGVVGGTSLGWLTNQVEGSYVDPNGVTQHYTSFTKIVWTGSGSPLWGQYTIVLDVYNDPAGGYHGLQTKVGAPGFGLNDHWTQ